jgi:hypothetical protein
MDELCLLVYRDFLTTEERTYNDKKYSTRYGLIRTIQKTNSNSNDKYAADRPIKYSLQIKNRQLKEINPISLGSTKPHRIKFDMEHLISLNPNECVPISLSLMPLLGYNFSYSKKYNVDDKYKYTSIAFA